MWPIGTPVIPNALLCIQRDNVGAMDHPQGRARIRLNTQGLKYKPAITYHVFKVITGAVRNIESPIGGGTISSQARKNAVGNFWKLEKMAKLQIVCIPPLLIDQDSSFDTNLP